MSVRHISFYFCLLINLFIYTQDFIHSPTSLSSHCSTSCTSFPPCLQEDVPTPHPHPPLNQTSKLPDASSPLRVRYIISDRNQTQQSSAVYVLGASYQLVYAALNSCFIFQFYILIIFFFSEHTKDREEKSVQTQNNYDV